MIRTRYILLTIFMLKIACAWGQGKLVFENREWDFGTIREADGRVNHTFTAQNRGDKPVVILDVVTSCGCTAPEFSRRPILPGAETQVKVTFDPANRPGTFVKELAVYSSERQKIAALIVKGNVVERQKSIEELYPVDAGSGLRLTETLCAFSYLYQGRRMHSSIGFINNSDRPLSLELTPLSSSSALTIDFPRNIAPGEKGEIDFSYHIPVEKPRYGTLSDSFRIYVDGKEVNTILVAHGIGVDNPAKTDPSKAPKSTMDSNIVKFGPIKRSAGIQRQKLTLGNEGSAPLVIRTAELSEGIGSSFRPETSIAAGSSYNAEISLDPAKFDFGIMSGNIMLVTNDPARPMRKIRVTAIIED